jgi:NADH dehydrogenase
VTLVGEGRRRHSFVSVRDVCAYTVAAVQSPAAERQTLPVGGPQPVSWRDIVAAAERVLGREIPVRTVGLGEPVPGLPDVMSGLLTALETFESPMEMEHLAATYRVTPTPLEEASASRSALPADLAGRTARGDDG